MEIFGGNRTTQHTLTSPGLDIWIDSRPQGGQAGGDIHYFSMCGSGRVVRLALADVSGHGPTVDRTAQWLRGLMRKHINLLDQRRFARAINRELAAQPNDDGHFATVLLLTYFAPTQHLIICNAGHPRPLWYRRRLDQWVVLTHDAPDLGDSIRESRGTYLLRPVANLPLGVVEETDYVQFAAKLEIGDLLLAYTDALLEARNPQGQQLQEEGLLHLLRDVRGTDPQLIARAVLARLDQWRGTSDAEDDQTLIVLHHSGSKPPPFTVTQLLRSAIRMLGFRPAPHPRGSAADAPS